LLSGWVSVAVTGTLAVRVRWTSEAFFPVGFLILPVDVRLQVAVAALSVPVQVTLPAS
jgi:hypothetical protein